jgi:hypothetical protein
MYGENIKFRIDENCHLRDPFLFLGPKFLTPLVGA